MFFGNAYNGKKVLVLGNTGFKGSWLTTWLLKLGANVTGFSDRVFSDPSMFSALGLKGALKFVQGDVTDPDAVADVISKCEPDFVFHLAAQPIVSLSYKEPRKTFETNIMGTVNVLEALRQYNRPCTAVIITSDKCYHNAEWVWGYRESDRMGGKDPYSSSKGAAELVASSYIQSFFRGKDCPVRIVTARAGNVIGGGDWALDRIVPDAARAWSENRSVVIRSPKATRPWQHVLEPLSGYLAVGQTLSENPRIHGESYNFGPRANQNKTVYELLLELAKTLGPAEVQAVDVQEVEVFKEAGLLKLSCDKALADLNWEPVLEFDECASFTSSWYRAFYDRNVDMLGFTNSQLGEYESLAAGRGLAWTKS